MEGNEDKTIHTWILDGPLTAVESSVPPSAGKNIPPNKWEGRGPFQNTRCAWARVPSHVASPARRVAARSNTFSPFFW